MDQKRMKPRRKGEDVNGNVKDGAYFPPRVKEDQLDSLDTVDIRFAEPASSLACICSA